eukprot:666238_1
MAAPCTELPTTSLFLAEFIRKFEKHLCSTSHTNKDFHLINFHARIYHLILQKIDSNNYAHHTQNVVPVDESLPRSLTMSIVEFSRILNLVERDIIQHFDFNHDCHPFIDKFFKLLRKQIEKQMNKKTQKKRKKRKLIEIESQMNHEPNKRQRTSTEVNDFGPYTRKHYLRDDEPRHREEAGALQFKLIYNDAREASWTKLVDLKEIFHECLPQMPTPYITRILFDKKHRSMIALMENEVFGGVCFRPFPERDFAEVVFLAISPNHQIKGFGTRLMNHLKETLKRMGIDHIVTFADNNAIDYFAKQGFELIQLDAVEDKCIVEKRQPIDDEIDALYGCKNLNFDQIIQEKYIKIYNGAKLMHSRIIKHINYCKLNKQLLQNRRVLVSKIGQISHSVKKRKGLEMNTNITDIPGIAEYKQCGDVTKTKSKLFATTQSTELVEVTARISGILKQLNSHSKVGVFNKPVDAAQAGDYYNVIKRPMDLSKIQKKLDQYQYKSMTQFIADFKLIITNCKLFNPKENPYHNHAIEFDEYFEKLMQQY